MAIFPELSPRFFRGSISLTLPAQSDSPQQDRDNAGGLAKNIRGLKNLTVSPLRFQKMLQSDKEAAVSMGKFAKFIDNIKSVFGFGSRQDALNALYDRTHDSSRTPQDIFDKLADFASNKENKERLVNSEGNVLMIDGVVIYDNREQQETTAGTAPATLNFDKYDDGLDLKVTSGKKTTNKKTTQSTE